MNAENAYEAHDIPSRSSQRRRALEILALAHQIVALSPAQLANLPLPKDIHDLVKHTWTITAHIARKRQMGFLAKHLRRLTAEEHTLLLQALDAHSAKTRQDTAMHLRAERWRERLMDEGDVALGALLLAHPQAEGQKIRQLVRNARLQRANHKPPRAFRELFKILTQLEANAGPSVTATDPPTAS